MANHSIITLDDLRNQTFLAQALEQLCALHLSLVSPPHNILSNANKTGIMTIGVTDFALVPLQAIAGDARAAALIDAQASKIASSTARAPQKEKWESVLRGLRDPRRRGLVELVAFPGFFTTASELCYPREPEDRC